MKRKSPWFEKHEIGFCLALGECWGLGQQKLHTLIKSKNVLIWNFFYIGGFHSRDGQIVETDKLPETTSHLSVKMGRVQFLTNKSSELVWDLAI